MLIVYGLLLVIAGFLAGIFLKPLVKSENETESLDCFIESLKCLHDAVEILGGISKKNTEAIELLMMKPTKRGEG